VSLVVQKYGGSSLTDADSIKRVARRIVETRKAGNEVCVVVSAMGDTTDELFDLAQQVSPLPPAREMDMLLTAGERMSMALVAMAIANLGHTARSFTGSQAGVITDSAHGRARIIDVTPGRIRGALDDGDIDHDHQEWCAEQEGGHGYRYTGCSRVQGQIAAAAGESLHGHEG